MKLSTLNALVQRELQDAFRNKWFVAYSLAFVVLCIALATMIVNSAGYGGISGFGRTAAGLINLVLFLAPLMGLTLGAQAISSEREQGTLAYLSAQPISVWELFISKFLGLAMAICAAIVIGFALSSLTITWLSGAQGIDVFIRLVGLTILLALVSLAIGLLISAGSDRTATSLGIAVVAWLALVLLGDLGLMGTAVAFGMKPGMLFALTMLNPLEAFRIGAVNQIRNSMELFGPAGLVARDWLGGHVTLVMALAMAVWLVIFLGLAGWVTARKERR